MAVGRTKSHGEYVLRTYSNFFKLGDKCKTSAKPGSYYRGFDQRLRLYDLASCRTHNHGHAGTSDGEMCFRWKFLDKYGSQF